MDCSWPQGNNACDGGLDFRAYEWMMEHDGQIATEASYPYLNADGYCRFSSSQPMAAKISVRECMHIRAGAVNEQKEWMDGCTAVPFSFIHFIHLLPPTNHANRATRTSRTGCRG